jgi:glycolate oxidase iron-sulfur subunit
MQTALPEQIRNTSWGREADRILRACVHCGFCTATCPTYQLLGDELDGPRGRIYQIKQVLEGQPAGEHVRLHLDRCLTCRACETTCPSGVEYGRLLDIGRREVERQAPRPVLQRWQRRLLLGVLPHPRRFGPLLRLGRWMRPLLPAGLRGKVPAAQPAGRWPTARHPRRMLVLDGCVQPSAAPQIDAAAARVLDRLGISLAPAPGAGCCGAVAHHLNAEEQALATARRNIDAWLPALEQGAEALVVTASGCAVHLKEYAHLLRDDPAYADKAARVTAAIRDLVEVVEQEDLAALGRDDSNQPLAFHAPCTLQHGERLPGRVEALLQRLGFQLTVVPDAHLCCGSAGTYSILQPELSGQLRERKLAALHSGQPHRIATANIGCLLHLGEGAAAPVVHWVQLLDELPGPAA